MPITATTLMTALETYIDARIEVDRLTWRDTERFVGGGKTREVPPSDELVAAVERSNQAQADLRSQLGVFLPYFSG